MNRRSVLLALAAAPFVHRALSQQTLYRQSLQSLLTRTNPALDFLLLDFRTRQILANAFAATPIPVGSLLKPFLALAFLIQPPRAALDVVCRGAADRCWKPHGVLTLPDALAQSCNAYFLALAATLSPESLTLPTPPPGNATPEDLIGLTPRWAVTPAVLVGSYAQLLSSAPSEILEGMRRAASEGTAIAIGRHPGGVLAKTGTAPCTGCKIPGDGLVLAAVPAVNPTLLLLVRQRGTNGATAAASAGHILRQIEALHSI